MTLDIDVQTSGIAMVGAWAALLWINGAVFPDGADQRFLHGTVGGEESCVFAVSSDLPWNILSNKLLCAGDTSVAGWIRGVDFHEFDP